MLARKQIPEVFANCRISYTCQTTLLFLFFESFYKYDP